MRIITWAILKSKKDEDRERRRRSSRAANKELAWLIIRLLQIGGDLVDPIMPQTRSADMAEAAEPDISRQRPNVARDISMPTFAGRSDENGKRWLDMFHRFATCYGWDESFRLAFVPYYLQDMALVWYENQDFSSWSKFVEEFKLSYADDTHRSRLGSPAAVQGI